jgi:hypothetical protein
MTLSSSAARTSHFNAQDELEHEIFSTNKRVETQEFATQVPVISKGYTNMIQHIRYGFTAINAVKNIIKKL